MNQKNQKNQKKQNQQFSEIGLSVLHSFYKTKIQSVAQIFLDLELTEQNISIEDLINELINLAKSGLLLNISSRRDQIWAITPAGYRVISSYKISTTKLLSSLNKEFRTPIKSDNMARLYYELTSEEEKLLSNEEIAAPYGYMVTTIDRSYTPTRVYITKTEVPVR